MDDISGRDEPSLQPGPAAIVSVSGAGFAALGLPVHASSMLSPQSVNTPSQSSTIDAATAFVVVFMMLLMLVMALLTLAQLVAAVGSRVGGRRAAFDAHDPLLGGRLDAAATT